MTRILSSIAWLLAGLLMAVPSLLALVGIGQIPLWLFLSYLFAGLGAALLAAAEGPAAVRIAAGVFAAGWLVWILAVVLWAPAASVIGGVVLAIGGLGLAVAVWVTRAYAAARRGAVAATGVLGAVLAVATLVPLPGLMFLPVTVLAGIALLAAGALGVRGDPAPAR